MKKTEQKPLYIREGRRFVKLGFGYQPNRMDVTGYFYNPDGTFSISRRDDSIGIVILQTPKERVIAGLKATRVTSWYEAKDHVYETFGGKGEFPTEIELILINKNKNIDKCNVDIILGDERCSYTSWEIYTDSSIVNYDSKNSYDDYCILGFVPILRIKL
jgi:hypothetical protein